MAIKRTHKLSVIKRNRSLPKHQEEVRLLEETTSTGEGSGLEVERDEVTISAPFDPSAIDVATQQRTIDLLLTRLREGELELSPDFQRRGNLWNETRKSGLIESILLRIPIPSLYFSEDANGDYAVVDGLQRLCAIAHFVDVAALNRSVEVQLDPLRLSNLQSLGEYKGSSYAELPRPLQRRINETELTIHVIRASTPPEVKFNIFARINQGGMPLTAQEIRNAIFPGAWRKKIRDMAKNSNFLAATENKIRGERMEDQELILRFVAHYISRSDRPGTQNLDDFLNNAVMGFKDWSDAQWRNVVKAFDKAMIAAPLVFGRHAFRKYANAGRLRNPINRGLFESESVALALLTDHDLDLLKEKQVVVLAKLEEVFKADAEFNKSLLYATGRGSSTNKRFESIRKVLKDSLNA